MHLSTTREYFTYHKPHFIYNLILLSKWVFGFHTGTCYYFSEFYLIIFNLLFLIMASMDITESDFQTGSLSSKVTQVHLNGFDM